MVKPDNAGIGDCPAVLASGTSCTVDCPAGYTLKGTATSCDFGTLTSQECIPNPCNVNRPLHGIYGSCTPFLEHNKSCQVGCDNGYTRIGAATFCFAGNLTAQTCELP
jgi:hypothetical protein